MSKADILLAHLSTQTSSLQQLRYITTTDISFLAIHNYYSHSFFSTTHHGKKWSLGEALISRNLYYRLQETIVYLRNVEMLLIHIYFTVLKDTHINMDFVLLFFPSHLTVGLPHWWSCLSMSHSSFKVDVTPLPHTQGVSGFFSSENCLMSDWLICSLHWSSEINPAFFF